jgi:hypothetical protein
VGQTVAGLQLGGTYHYRAVASYGAGQVLYGRDRSFTLALGKPKLEIDPLGQVLVGSSFMLTGTLTGANNAGRMVALQATAYPYLDPFATIGPAALTNGSGRFAFRVANLSSSTEFRVLTIEPAPLYSPVIRVGAALHVTLHARASRVGLVRLYGTVSPTAVRAPVYIQLEKEALPSPRASGEGATRWVTEFITVVRRGSHTVSRFSAVVRVRHTGHYRAYVRLRPGRLSSGFSAQTVFLRARRATH